MGNKSKAEVKAASKKKFLGNVYFVFNGGPFKFYGFTSYPVYRL
jgi:hypothetical protein